MKPSRARFNFVLEGLTLINLMAMIATGFIMKWRLPPGSGGGEGHGGGGGGGMGWGGGGGRGLGRGGGDSLTLGSLSRHEWGDVHFWLAISFVVLLVLHLFLHWRWIWAMAQGPDPARRRCRGLLFLAATVLFLLIAALPWLVAVKG